ncbi:MAG: nucleotidyl transferase AbiEii/AbiGii toxin family protein [Firmicutes bacterium]|nr:nucleotidyl transferase AbiEii/AbiGii toxin family protein [Bacillota bacterium]
MYNIAKLPATERQLLFQNTGAKIGMNAAVVEKDFWVCLTLDYLFRSSRWKDCIAFKGGTSLSKSYKVIERFSEDIDLILDWRVLGYEKDEPWGVRSNTKQQKFIEESRERLFSFLKKSFVPEFKGTIETLLGREVNISIDNNDAGIVNFSYPNLFADSSILQAIRLEIGALAAWTPTQITEVTPYSAEQYPNVFKMRSTKVLTTTAERSFWEKATILHQEASRPESSLIPTRYSRHYYDLFCMSKTPIKDSALKQPELLEEVARFKEKFYPRKWAKYNLAKMGTLKLIPASHSVARLRDDYSRMREMIFGEYPSYEEIMEGIRNLEEEVNGK